MEKPKTLQQAIRYFADEDRCIKTVAALRWPDGPVCPACEHRKHYYLNTQRRWKCKECGRQFSVKLGTIFEDSPVPLDKWLTALWLLANCKNGISSHELARSLGVTQKSAWFMLHRIRLALRSGTVEKLGGGEIEADETYVGGNPLRMHKSRRLRLNQARSAIRNIDAVTRYPGKTAVMGMLDREARKVRAMVIPNVRRVTVQEKILSHVEDGAKLYTDESTSYLGLTDKFAHEVINHLDGYVRGRVHTNGIENFWSLLKRGLRGTYVAVEPFHLDRYVDEQVFRYNHRKSDEGKKLTDSERFESALSQIAGKRLTYQEVTGKVGEAAF